MLYSFLLGAIQGVAEWLPVSSEGLIVFIETYFGGAELTEVIRLALFLHFGTFLAALVYFRREVWELLLGILNYGKANAEIRGLIRFYFVATLVSGGLGFGILKMIEGVEENFALAGRVVLIALGGLLLVTGGLQVLRKSSVGRESREVHLIDSVLVGLAQGFAVFPGLSRSGLTTAMLLLRNFKEETALKLSFILSMPIVLAGNILLNYDRFSFSSQNFAGLLAAFLFGIATIHVMLKVAERVRFGPFVMGFAGLVFLSAFFV